MRDERNVGVMTSPAFDDRIRADFAEAVARGLSQAQKVIPARYFYDQRGSELFEAITQLPEYYLTRAEVELLHTYSDEIRRIVGRGRVVVEFGSGSSMKTPEFIAAVGAAAYVPIDISAEFLFDAARGLAGMLPDVAVLPVAADFTQPVELPEAIKGKPMLGFFPGSTIGNLTPGGAADLLRAFRETLRPDPWLVIGIDLKKSPRLIEAAYDDDAGVTAAFNLNMLVRINRELGGDIPVAAFEHRAVWNNELGRMEMHLAAIRAVDFEIAGNRYQLAEGETIHTENSHKYSIEEARLIARVAGWLPVKTWIDSKDLFSLHLWRALPVTLQP